MKKGKSVKLNLYNPIKTVYGTVDSKKLKSILQKKSFCLTLRHPL